MGLRSVGGGVEYDQNFQRNNANNVLKYQEIGINLKRNSCDEHKRLTSVFKTLKNESKEKIYFLQKEPKWIKSSVISDK